MLSYEQFFVVQFCDTCATVIVQYKNRKIEKVFPQNHLARRWHICSCNPLMFRILCCFIEFKLILELKKALNSFWKLSSNFLIVCCGNFRFICKLKSCLCFWVTRTLHASTYFNIKLANYYYILKQIFNVGQGRQYDRKM